MIAIIDNYDSFTYNLVQRIGELEPDRTMEVYRNDKITVEEIAARKPTHLIVSPGPCTPREGGISNDAVRYFEGRIPVLGVCLGHQCIGFSHGATVERNYRLMHGKTSMIHHDGKGVFSGLSNPFEATRYHSLIVRERDLPQCLTKTAWTDNGLMMGLRHRQYPVWGVQFHPEAILTGEGKQILGNFLAM